MSAKLKAFIERLGRDICNPRCDACKDMFAAISIIQKQAEALEKIIYSTTYRTLADNMELAISAQEEIEKLCEEL